MFRRSCSDCRCTPFLLRCTWSSPLHPNGSMNGIWRLSEILVVTAQTRTTAATAPTGSVQSRVPRATTTTACPPSAATAPATGASGGGDSSDASQVRIGSQSAGSVSSRSASRCACPSGSVRCPRSSTPDTTVDSATARRPSCSAIPASSHSSS